MVGSADYILTLWNTEISRNPLTETLSRPLAAQLEDYQKTTLLIGVVVLLLHLLAFLASVVLSFVDVQISLEFNYDNSSTATSWTAFALSDSVFR